MTIATMDSAIAGMGNRSVATDEVLRSWAEDVRNGAALTQDELKRYFHGYLRVAYPDHYLDAEPVERTSLHLQRDISDDIEVIGKMIEAVNSKVKQGEIGKQYLKASRSGKYNRQLIISLALLRLADTKVAKANAETTL